MLASTFTSQRCSFQLDRPDADIESFHGISPMPGVLMTFYTPFSPWNSKNNSHNTKTVIVQMQDYLSTEAPFAVMLRKELYICVGYERDTDTYHLVTRRKECIHACRVSALALLAEHSLECLFVHMFEEKWIGVPC